MYFPFQSKEAYYNQHKNFFSRSHYSPCPFCIAHCEKLGLSKKEGNKRFNKWHNRPQSAHKLYWKLHPEERFWGLTNNR